MIIINKFKVVNDIEEGFKNKNNKKRVEEKEFLRSKVVSLWRALQENEE